MKRLLVLLLLAAGLLVSGSSYAQCPDPSWTGPNSIGEVLAPGCIATVYYCERNNAGVLEFTITAIIAPSGCSPLTYEQIIQQAIAAFTANPPIPASYTIVPCGQGTTSVIKVTASPCWHLNSAGLPVEYGPPVAAGVVVLACGEASCYTDCEWCQMNGQNVQVSCTSSSSSNNWHCDPYPANPEDVQWDVCYNVLHCP